MYVEFRRGKDNVIIDNSSNSSTNSHFFILLTELILFGYGSIKNIQHSTILYRTTLGL